MIKKYFDPLKDIEGLATVSAAKEAVDILKAQFEDGHGKSGYILALLLSPSNVVLSDEIKNKLLVSDASAINWHKRAYEALLAEATSGNPESMYLISQYFQTGLPPVSIDLNQCEYWLSKAKKAGYHSIQY